MNNPEISVILTTYNPNITYLKESIDSVVNQKFEQFELITIIDNPLNFEVISLINDYKDKDERIRISINECNIGLAESLNRAIKLSRGKYIARLDEDDLMLSDRLIKQYNFLNNNPEIGIVSCGRVDINENSEVNLSKKYYVYTNNSIPKLLKFGCPLTHSSIMVRRNIYEELNGYRNFRYAEDYDFYLRCLSKDVRFFMIPEILIKYRINMQGITKTNPYKMVLYSEYAKMLYTNREKNNSEKDNFSTDNLNKYLNRNRINDQHFLNKMDKSILLLYENMKKKNIVLIIFQLMGNNFVRRIFLKSLAYKIITKKYQHLLSTYNESELKA